MGKYDSIFSDEDFCEDYEELGNSDNFNSDEVVDFEDDDNSDNVNKEESNKFKALINKIKGNDNAKIIALGIIIIGVAIISWNIFKSIGNRNKNEEEVKNTESNTVQYVQEPQVVEKEVVKYITNTIEIDTETGWQRFTGAVDLSGISVVELSFTVIDVNNYVKQMDDNTIQLKSRITGALSGIAGTYDIDVDFSIMNGNTIEKGKSFLVDVTLASYNGKTVVTDIKIK